VGVVDDIQMTTTLICLDLKLVHHFIEGTGIDTTDINTDGQSVSMTPRHTDCRTVTLTLRNVRQ
jgi:hypothetical protein